jgi:dihydroorotate dehydrogenase
MTLKISPDLEDAQLTNIDDALRRHRIDAVIATNTTVARDQVQGIRHGNEQGGLSGAPVFEASTTVVRKLAQALGDELPIIAAGGVLEGTQARAKLDAGAKLVQLYSGLIYRGPELVPECVRATAHYPQR